MAGFDKTKQNIGIDKLDEQDRKKLFNDFVAAGGKVEAPHKRSPLTIDREKQAEYKNKIESLQKSKANAPRATILKQNHDLRQGIDGVSIFLRIKTALHLFFARVTGLNTFFLKDAFFNKLFGEYRMALENLNKIFLFMFQLNQSMGKSIIFRLDGEKPLYFELIEMTSNLYEKEYFQELLDNYNSLPKTLTNHRDEFLYLMKKICVLKPYENIILNSYLKSLEYYVYYTGDKSRYSEYRHAIKHSLFLIFHKLYYQLYWLTVRYTREDPNYDFNAIYKLLSIADNERPGNRMANDKPGQYVAQEKASEKTDNTNKEETSNKDNKDEIKEKVAELSDEIKLGLKLMSKINTMNLINEYDRDKLFSEMSASDRADKTFKTFLLFIEFEKEYSFILSTNKIKYNVYFTSSGKINYAKQLQDLYDLMQKPWILFKEFKTEHQNYVSLSQEKPIGNQQYMIHANKLKSIEQNKNQISQKARNSVLDFLNELFAILQELQDDLHADSRLISNPQEVLVFDTRVEGKKKLAGIKVFEAMNSIAAYVEAFIFRLSRNGDLYGLPSEKNASQEIVVDTVMYDEPVVYVGKVDSSEDNTIIKDSDFAEYYDLYDDDEDADSSENNTSSEGTGSFKDNNQVKDANTQANSNLTKGTSDPNKPKDPKSPQSSGSGNSIFNELDDLL